MLLYRQTAVGGRGWGSGKRYAGAAQFKLDDYRYLNSMDREE
jgi:hypothetical protein